MKEYLKCIECKKDYSRYKYPGKTTRFCSRICKGNWQKNNIKGQQNPNYRDGSCIKLSHCLCGKLKDYRALECATCARKSFSKDGSVLFTIEQLKEQVSICKTLSETARALNVSRHLIAIYVKKYEINISHFKAGRDRLQSVDKLFVISDIRRNATIKSAILRNKLIDYKCSECNKPPVWNNKPLVLQLDHINGNPLDNRLPNLRFLCPDCHSQTETHVGRGSKGVSKGGKKK
jgi:hypothetical protein